MRSASLCFLLVGLLSGCVASPENLSKHSFDDRERPLRITLNKTNASELELQVELHYFGTNELAYFYQILPWYKGTIEIVAVSTRIPGGLILERIPEPVGTMWVGGRKTLRFGDKLYGNIKLSEWFPEILHEAAMNDVLVFWSYLPPKSAPLVSERQSGWLLIPSLK